MDCVALMVFMTWYLIRCKNESEHVIVLDGV